MTKNVILLLFNIALIVSLFIFDRSANAKDIPSSQVKTYSLQDIKNLSVKEQKKYTLITDSIKQYGNKRYKLIKSDKQKKEYRFLSQIWKKIKVIYKYEKSPEDNIKRALVSSGDKHKRKNKARIIDISAPEGFDEIDSDLYTLVNVYFGDSLVTNIFATVNSKTITFSNPKAIIDNIDGILNKDKILQSLTGALDVNSQYSCFPEITLGCGYVPGVEVVEVVYSRNIFRADIMINPEYVSKDHDPFTKYVTSSQKGISTITNFNNIFTGSNGADGEDNYSLNGETLISYKNSHIEADYNYSSDSQVIYNNIVGKHYYKDIEFRAGLTSMQDLSIISSPKYMGFGINRFFTSSDELGMVYGSKIQLFLPYRSRVKIFKDGKLLHSSNYDFGNQIINTASLPMGAYDIDVQIQDGRGLEKKTMFFVKSNRMPPADRPLYYLDLGVLEDTSESSKNVPEASNKAIFRFGTGKRITKSTALIGNVISTEEELIFEPSIEVELKNIRLSNGYLVTSKQDHGISATIESSVSRDSKFNYNLGFRKVIQGKKDSAFLANDLSYDSVSNTSSRYSTSLNYSFKDGTIGLQGQRTKNSFSPVNYNYGPFLEKNILRKRGFWVNLRGDINKYHDRVEYLLNFRVFYNQGRWSVRSTTSKHYIGSQDVASREEDNFKTTQNIVWQDQDLLDEDLTISALYDFENDSRREEMGMDYKGKYGRIDADVIHDDASTRYNGNLQFSFLSNNANFAMGGREFKKGAVLINVKGDKNSDSIFNVATGFSNKENARIGHKTPVMLSPFRSYNISLSAAKETLADFNNQTQKIGIMPGNVITVEWSAKEAVIILGTMIFRNNIVVANASVSSSLEVSQTGEDGLFQLYSYRTDKIIAKLSNGISCIAKLPEDVEDYGAGVLNVGEIVCIVQK